MSSGRCDPKGPSAAQEALADEGRAGARAPMAAVRPVLLIPGRPDAGRRVPAGRLRGLGHARRRDRGQQSRLPCAGGTLMRHVLCAGPPTPASIGVEEAASSGSLVGLLRPALGCPSGLLGASARTIDLSPIAPAADQHLVAATAADVKPRRPVLVRIGAHAWTPSDCCSIIFRHSRLRSVGRGAGSNLQVVVGAAPVLDQGPRSTADGEALSSHQKRKPLPRPHPTA